VISCSNKLNSPAPVIASNNLNVNPSFNFLYPKAKQKKLVYMEQRAERSFERGMPYWLGPIVLLAFGSRGLPLLMGAIRRAWYYSLRWVGAIWLWVGLWSGLRRAETKELNSLLCLASSSDPGWYTVTWLWLCL